MTARKPAAKVKPPSLKARMNAAELDLLSEAEKIRVERDIPPYFMGIVYLNLAAEFMRNWEKEVQSTPLSRRRPSAKKGSARGTGNG